MPSSKQISELEQFVFPCLPVHGKGNIALVFGSPHHVDNFTNNIIDLWKTGSVNKFVFSGHRGEAANMANECVRNSLPVELVSLEERATNTRENVVLSLPYISEAQNKFLVVVAKNYSVARVLMTVEKCLPRQRLAVSSVDLHGVSLQNWLHNQAFVDKMRSELKKIVTYVQKGDLALPSSPPKTLDDLQRFSGWMAELCVIGKTRPGPNIQGHLDLK